MKKLTTMIVAILCLVMIVSGCGNAPANANEQQTETASQQVDSTDNQEKTDSSDVSEATEESNVPEVSVTSDNMLTYENGISWWYMSEKDGSAILSHRIGPDRSKDVEDVYVFDSGSGIEAGQCTLIDVNDTEDLFLLKQHRSFYTFNLSSKELTCIVDCYLDYTYQDEKLRYLDIYRTDNVIDWQNSTTAQPTNQMLVAYREDYTSPEPNEEFKARFLEIQTGLKAGVDPSEFTDVEIMTNGDIYDLNGNYLGNAHLPYPFEKSSLLQFDEDGMEIMNEGQTIAFYRYGEVVKRFTLASPGWTVIRPRIDYKVDPETLFSSNATAKEISDNIAEVELLMYNYEDRSVWKFSDTGIDRLCDGVADYQEHNGVLYWMDSMYIPYTLNWIDSNESHEAGPDVVAIAHYEDEHAGFVVRPEDSRANAEVDGLSIYIP
jgi:hypothetical protein